MTKIQQKHLKTRKISPFNVASKDQEKVAVKVANNVWDKILKKYPNYEFDNLKTLGLSGLDAKFCVNYINRGYNKKKLPLLDPETLQAYGTASGIRPDGGVFFVKSKSGDFLHIIGALEVKHQGEYDGYTPLSDTDWKKRCKTSGQPANLNRLQRPPQAQGNAIERFAKNANAIKTLTSFYGYNPYVVLCEGFDFYLRDEYKIFAKQPYSGKFQNRDSSILMRLIAGNDWQPLNKVYVGCMKHGESVICPATIMARMQKWTVEDGEKIMLDVIDKSLKHLKSIGEIA